VYIPVTEPDHGKQAAQLRALSQPSSDFTPLLFFATLLQGKRSTPPAQEMTTQAYIGQSLRIKALATAPML